MTVGLYAELGSVYGCVCFQDMTGAAQHLRHAKGLDPMVTAAKSGLPVDITKVINMHLQKRDILCVYCVCVCVTAICVRDHKAKCSLKRK